MRLQDRGLGRGDLGRVGHQLAEAGGAVRGGVGDDPVLDRDLVRRNRPFAGRGLDQHGPGAGAGQAQLVPAIVDRGRATRALDAVHQGVAVELGVGHGLLDLDPVPVGVELLGDDGRQSDVIALAHVLVLVDHRHGPVGGDLDEGAEGGLVGLLGPQAQDIGRRAADQQRPAGQGGADDQAAAGGLSGLGGFGDGVHGLSPPHAAWPEASLIAARMRW